VLWFSRSISPRQKFHRYFSRSLGEYGFKVSTLPPASFSTGSLGPRAHDFLAVGCLLRSHYQSGPGVPLLCVRTPASIFLALVRALSHGLCVGSYPAAGSLVLEPFLDFSAPILITGGCWFCLHPVLGLHSNSQLLVVANFGQLGRAVGNIFL
jgi:hypothetical protein